MPITIPNDLPAREILEGENIFVMDSCRAERQDIRPLRIIILNLMPTKIETETQFLRLLSNSPLQVEVTLMHTASYESKNTQKSHLDRFYHTFSEIKDKKFDGMIITGAPIEHLDFEKIAYWDELTSILEWAKTNVFSIFYSCWGAFAGLYFHYGLSKITLPKKLSGVYRHDVLDKLHPLMFGFDDEFYAPHSRHCGVDLEGAKTVPYLQILSVSGKAGAYLLADTEKMRFFVTGHPEYDTDTLAKEYFRDVDKGIEPEIPENYFQDNDPQKTPIKLWRSHANLLFSNWLNFYVYQSVPYNW
jgi:homoserine O-succinyltransferase